ncbi:MAG: tRNA uridine-5-carboxymethylaminomethyl(34) synthesis enzyme MnmG [Proteobacteria bacterium]|nr:tRNA uridine-5-carboxymethylaminomethyl(34) synthesis enzyme MnmG [Pseudomonadota bacterium]
MLNPHNSNRQYDVIVIGGGHAGTEAALAAARTGAATLLLTHNIETIGQMSCNPAIGGIGKGHLVREVDALGGIMAQAADAAGIQFRTLNASKGPAVRATRAQCDRTLYKSFIREAVEYQPGLQLFQAAVDDLIVEQGKVCGCITSTGLHFMAPAVVLTVGTFLGGVIHIGDQQQGGGRAGDQPSNALAQRLRALPFTVGRLKTGTPPRIDGRSVDFSVLEEQPGDQPMPAMSYLGSAADHPQQRCCWIAYTTEETHQIIRESLHLSAIHSGNIEGSGPRYCPSIEDKITRFADKNSHQVFIEPEGLNTTELYPNGLSTSLPFAVQEAFIRSMKGFETAHLSRPGYAIEYDYFDPRGLQPSLETRYVDGLFFAGQINGTTGYEEAAAQGLMAGLNAARKVNGQSVWTPRRDQAYIGVLIDDLISQGTKEPYRMFTSRAEYRLTLREDNADLRLTEKGRELGLVNDIRWQAFESKREAITKEQQRLGEIWLTPANAAGKDLNSRHGVGLSKEVKALDLLKRPEMNYTKLLEITGLGPGVADPKVAEQVEIQVKYAGYLNRQQQEVSRNQRMENQRIPDDFEYSSVNGLSAEVEEKLTDQRPQTIGQAGRIPGVTPASISLLLVYLKRHAAERNVA